MNGNLLDIVVQDHVHVLDRLVIVGRSMEVVADIDAVENIQLDTIYDRESYELSHAQEVMDRNVDLKEDTVHSLD